jgi:hypothetical protein
MGSASISCHSAILLLCIIAMVYLGTPSAIADGQVMLLHPGDLVYKGAFRLPASDDGWTYGCGGLTYYPGGDPGGEGDGYPGSLFGIGNDQRCEITEISIPEPRISAGKRVDDLNTATTLQPFSPVLNVIFTPADDGLPQRADVAYLAAQDGQTSGKLYLTWGEHYQYEQVPSHAWSELDLSHALVQGPWYLSDYENFATDDYLFGIPEIWAAQNTPGLLLATGRFRDGSLGGSGPSLIAFGPWNDGNPPAKNARLTHVKPLLLYGKGYEQEGQDRVMRGYTNADEWTGGAWVTSGNRSAVIFAGTKGRGKFWYGFSNGVVWPDNPPYPEYPPAPHNDRGWWAESFDGAIIFFSPDDLAKVAGGAMAPYAPQPYAELKVDSYLYHVNSPLQKMHVGAVAFDRDRGILYLSEPFADGDQPIIHVFETSGTPPGSTSGMTPVQAPVNPASAPVSGSAPGDGPEEQPGPSEAIRAPGFSAGIAIIAMIAYLVRQRMQQ